MELMPGLLARKQIGLFSDPEAHTVY